MNIYEFNSRIQQIREKNGLSQKAFAAKIGVSAVAVSAWKRKNILPDFGTVVKIAETFDVSLDWLCGNSAKVPQSQTLADQLKEIVDFADAYNAELSYEEGLLSMSIRLSKAYNIAATVQDLVIGQEFIKTFQQWQDIRKLKQDGTIDEDFYNTWLKGKYAELEEYPYCRF